MSVIIGHKTEDGKVYIGGDSVATSGWGVQQSLPKEEGKVFRNGDAIFGTAGSCRAMQVLHYNFTMPDRNTKQSSENYMNVTFVSAVIKCLKDNQCAEVDNGVISFVNSLLIGYDGELYKLSSDFSLSKIREQYHTLGIGGMVSHGAMHIMFGNGCLRENPEDSIRLALDAACQNNAYCAPPFEIISTERESKEGSKLVNCSVS